MEKAFADVVRRDSWCVFGLLVRAVFERRLEYHSVFHVIDAGLEGGVF